MITKDRVEQEINDLLEYGCMTNDCVEQLVMLYFLHERLNEHKMTGPLTLDDAKEWVHGMKSADGSHGEHWSFEATSQVLHQKNLECNPVEFYATMNMLWSDYCKVAEKYTVNNLGFWSDMSRAFLMDTDAVKDKLTVYRECIAE